MQQIPTYTNMIRCYKAWKNHDVLSEIGIKVTLAGWNTVWKQMPLRKDRRNSRISNENPQCESKDSNMQK